MNKLVLMVSCAAALAAAWPAFAQKNPERNVYYGETHVHTSWSLDAFAFGDRVTGPEDFYRYAQGEATPHPGGYQVRITKPLDWGAVTEHAEYAGMVQEAMNPDSPLRKSSPLLARVLDAGVHADPLLAFKALSVTIATGHAIEQARGFNPYRFGAVGGSDSHVSVVPYRQKNFFGVHGTVDDTPEKRIAGATVLGLDSLWVSPAGLSAVWAEENTRESIFSAMQRKETYATSGVRIPVRLFGGWALDAGLLAHKDWLKSAYASAVPMGGDLAAPKAKAPSFVVWASKDPDSANLDRIQIIKGWSKSGQSFEKIYDVAWAGSRRPDPATGKLPPIGSTVDFAQGTYTDDIGAVELKTVWTDPEFDASLDAFYYARVLEIPTPRWSTMQAVKLGKVPPSGKGYGAAIQERAWSSPIWYTPSAEARKAARPNPTVAELRQQGAQALSDAELKELVVGKTLDVHNRVTGQHFEILYGAGGRRLVMAIDGRATDLREVGELMHGGEVSYEIRDGQLVTDLNGTPFAVSVYKLGDRYLAARSNEFGYANYEVQAARQ